MSLQICINGLYNQFARNELLRHIRDIIERGIRVQMPSPISSTYLVAIETARLSTLSQSLVTSVNQLSLCPVEFLHFTKLKNVEYDIRGVLHVFWNLSYMVRYMIMNKTVLTKNVNFFNQIEGLVLIKNIFSRSHKTIFHKSIIVMLPYSS